MALPTHKQIINHIEQSKKILLLTRENPSGDGLGSSLALSLALDKIKKSTHLSAHTEPDHKFHFLPFLKDKLKPHPVSKPGIVLSIDTSQIDMGELSYEREGDKLNINVTPKKGKLAPDHVEVSTHEHKDHDLIIICDTPELETLGPSFEKNPNFFYQVPLVNIDHSPSNEGYGKINLINVNANSTAEVVWKLLRALDEKLIDKDVATSLLTGIIVKTDSFQDPKTSPETMTIAAELLARGARQQEIVKHLYKTKPLSRLKMWGVVLSRAEYDQNSKTIWSQIPKEEWIKHQANHDDLRELSKDLLSGTPTAELILILYENPKDSQITAYLNAPKQYNAREIANQFHDPEGDDQEVTFNVKQSSLKEARGHILDRIRALISQN